MTVLFIAIIIIVIIKMQKDGIMLFGMGPGEKQTVFFSTLSASTCAKCLAMIALLYGARSHSLIKLN